MLRVLLYYPRARAGDGGMTHAVRSLADELTCLGTQVTIVFDGGEIGPTNDGIRWIGLRHVGRRFLRFPLGLSDAFKDADVVVLHSAWTSENVRAAAVARRLSLPYVLAPRGSYDPMIVRRKRLLKQSWFALFERTLIKRARAIHVFFDSEAAHLRSLGYRGEFVVAPNGVRTPDGRAWDGGSGGYLLWLGRFDPEHKGLDILLDAMARIPVAQRTPLRLHGPDWRERKGAVRHRIAELGLESSVTVGDPVYEDEKWRLLERAAGFVYPSRWEAFGNSPAEAVAMGVPTLVTPYPLGRHLSDNGAAFVAAATPESLADGLKRLTSSDAARVAANGARFVRSELTWGACARAWLQQLEALA